MSQVDLDALDATAINLRKIGHAQCAKRVETAVDELRELRELVGCATVFRIGNSLDVQRRVGYTGVKWIVSRGSDCLTKSGQFEYEPMPSNRSNEFIQRTRWDSLPEALAAARQWEAENAKRPRPSDRVARWPTERGEKRRCAAEMGKVSMLPVCCDHTWRTRLVHRIWTFPRRRHSRGCGESEERVMQEMPMVRPSQCRMCQAKDQRLVAQEKRIAELEGNVEEWKNRSEWLDRLICNAHLAFFGPPRNYAYVDAQSTMDRIADEASQRDRLLAENVALREALESVRDCPHDHDENNSRQ